ncbi:MAG: hypothetical protein SGPRY_004325 [Prymnesium sp.]
MRAALLGCAVLLLQAQSISASCSASAKYADGTELKRECIVEGEGRTKPSAGARSIDEEWAWLKNTRWNWNNWRDVLLKSDGSFIAPAEGCENAGNPNCRWSTDEDRLYVHFGGAGRHTLTVASDQQSMFGARDRDGDEVTAYRR